MAASKPSIPKGTRDFGPIETSKRTYIIETIKKSFTRYGFSQIETPAMEQLSVLTGKYGDEGDKLLFKILNSGDFLKKTSPEDYQKGSSHLLPLISEKGLRYDLTVPFARFVVQNQHAITLPFKRFQIQPVWRADRPQKGRYREFYQCDADIVGTDSLWNEAELTLMIHEVFFNLNYKGFLLSINHREILMELARYCGLAGKEMQFCVTIDKLDKIGFEKVNEELQELGADKQKLTEMLKMFNNHESNLVKLEAIEHLLGSNKGTTELRDYFDYLGQTRTENLKIKLDSSLARGLTYYTGLIFEVKATDVKIGSITGGGRYDNLTGAFGLPGISGVGISFGLDRIYDVLEEKNLFPDHLNSNTNILISHFDENCFNHGIKLLVELRDKGVSAEIYPDQAKMKKQMNYADKKNIPYVLVIGPEEIASGEYSFKNMKTGEQKLLSLDEIIKSLLGE